MFDAVMQYVSSLLLTVTLFQIPNCVTVAYIWTVFITPWPQVMRAFPSSFYHNYNDQVPTMSLLFSRFREVFFSCLRLRRNTNQMFSEHPENSSVPAVCQREK